MEQTHKNWDKNKLTCSRLVECKDFPLNVTEANLMGTHLRGGMSSKEKTEINYGCLSASRRPVTKETF